MCSVKKKKKKIVLNIGDPSHLFGEILPNRYDTLNKEILSYKYDVRNRELDRRPDGTMSTQFVGRNTYIGSSTTTRTTRCQTKGYDPW